MKKTQKPDISSIIAKELILLFIGGFLYVIIELLFRGRSHPTMFVLGGLCFVLIGLLNERFPWEMPLVCQMVISALMVTAFEFIFGIIFNVILHMGVWDYSKLPYNILGQVCLLFTNLWAFLSLAAIVVDDWIRYLAFGEEKPHYRWFTTKPPDPPFDGI